MLKLPLSDKGVMRILSLLIVVTAIGIISFLLISSTGPFSGIFNKLFSKSSSYAAEVIPSTCPDSLQARINAAAVGSTVTLNQNCVYREEVTVNKSLILDGGNIAQIRGSDIWDNSVWVQQGGTWVSNKTVPLTNNNSWGAVNFNGGDGRCLKEECLYPVQVFIDGAKSKLVLRTTPGPGQFSVDSNFNIPGTPAPITPPHIILGGSPIGHIVEVTTRKHWIISSLQPTDTLTVKNFTMKHAGGNAQDGALGLNWCSRCQPTTGQVIIQNNDLTYAHGENVDIYSNTKLINNDIHSGEDFGFAGGNLNGNNPSGGVLIQGNKLHDNNTEDTYNMNWGAGGEKTTLNTGLLTFNFNEVYGNHGPGLWCDISCRNVTYSNNIVHDNIASGIMYEISDGGKIFGNKVWNNGIDSSGYGWGPGILLSSSANTEVYNNVVAWNADGISVISQQRCPTVTPDCPDWWNKSIGNYIHDNSIIKNAKNTGGYWDNLALAWLQDGNGVMSIPASNNRGANNKYWYDQPESFFSTINSPQFAWSTDPAHTTYFSLVDFNATPGEKGGRYLTNTEKDTILAQNLMPNCPTCVIPSPTSTPSPTPSATPTCSKGPLGDIDCNGIVNLFDYSILVTNFGKTVPANTQGDLDGNGIVNLFDYSVLVTNFGK